MDMLLARAHFKRPRGSFYQFVAYLLSIVGLVFVLSSYGSIALAASTPSSGQDQRFTKQLRLGFHAGDDWEPSITADRFGHVYALYKHYN